MVTELAAQRAELAAQGGELAVQKAANDERAHKQWSRILLHEAGVRDRERVVLEREKELENTPKPDWNPATK